ncbi:MAG: hypothetical protein ACREWG_04050 [Gammaproteobacteria bacterium]
MSANEDSDLVGRNGALERELTAMVGQINDGLVIAMDLSDQIEELRVRNAEMGKVHADDLPAYFRSKAYRTGSAMVGTFRRLRLALHHPLVRRSYRVIRRLLELGQHGRRR